jgi:putative toxin-antitoxin system antitoxin component (TIGR02293 family)
MTVTAMLYDQATQPDETADVRQVAELLGGARVLRSTPRSPLDAHEMLLHGLPGNALRHLIDSLSVLEKSASLEKAVGMSLRTFQRRKDAPARRLSQEQSGRTWKFAEILAKATAAFGSREAAEQWLQNPVMGLDQRRPIDLLATPAGVELVEVFLERLKYGVYM